MNEKVVRLNAEESAGRRIQKIKGGRLAGAALAVIAVAVGGALAFNAIDGASSAHAASAPSLPVVDVSTPVQQNLEARLGALGQFSAVQRVEVRAQVGGTLTRIHFKDGDVVRKGDALFDIDTVPYEIKLAQATAQLEAANARLNLATREMERAEALRRTDAGSEQNVDQRGAEKLAAQAAVSAAKALVRDARFDLDRCHITAPFSGRISTHQVSVGNLISGSRAGAGGTTLLTTIVSMDPVYLDFDMSESDYATFVRARAQQKGTQVDKVDISVGDSDSYGRRGTLDFVDNALDRSSGTIHARAIVPNKDLSLTPGAFGRVRLALSAPTPHLLVPDASVLADQTDRIVLTVDQDNKIVPKKVETGDLRGGLRVIRSGLTAEDKVVVAGITSVAPGVKVTPHASAVKFGSD